MFSHNGMISEKQMRCILMLYVFTGSIFVLPYLFAKIFGKEILMGIITYCILAAVYVGIIFRIDRQGKEKKPARAAVFINIIRYLIRMSFYIILSIVILSEGQVPFVERDKGNSFGNLCVLLPLLIVALYGANRSLEKQGRINEMIFLAAFIPYVIMLVFGMKEIDRGFLRVINPLNAVGTGNLSAYKILIYSYGLLTFVTQIEIYPRLKLHVDNKHRSDVGIYLSVVAMIALSGLLSLIMSGIYGIGGIGRESMASIAIMRYIELPLGVLRRFDLLMVWFFMTGCFALFCNTLFFVRNELLKVIPEEACKYALVTIMASACVIAIMSPEYENVLGAFVVYGAIIDIPLSLIILIYERLSGNKKRKTAAVSFLAVLMLVSITGILTGCYPNIENVEQRDYATVLVCSASSAGNEDLTRYSKQTETGKGLSTGRYHYVLAIAGEHRLGEKNEPENTFETDADDLDELSRIYGERKGKELSLSHLKVIINAMDNTDNNEEAYNSFNRFINELDDESEVAKTCPLLFATDTEMLKDYIRNAESPVGTYISDIVRIEKRNKIEIPKLMDYLKALRESEWINIYVLEKEGNDLKIEVAGE